MKISKTKKIKNEFFTNTIVSINFKTNSLKNNKSFNGWALQKKNYLFKFFE